MTKEDETEVLTPEQEANRKKIARLIQVGMGSLRAEIGYQGNFIPRTDIEAAIASRDWLGYLTELVK